MRDLMRFEAHCLQFQLHQGAITVPFINSPFLTLEFFTIFAAIATIPFAIWPYQLAFILPAFFVLVPRAQLTVLQLLLYHLIFVS